MIFASNASSLTFAYIIDDITPSALENLGIETRQKWVHTKPILNLITRFEHSQLNIRTFQIKMELICSILLK